MRLAKFFLCTWLLGLTLCSESVLAQTPEPNRPEFAQASQQLDLGGHFFKQRNYEQALIHYKAALAVGTPHQQATAHGNIGLILLFKGRFEESVQAFSEAIRLDSQHALAYANRGVALEKLKRFQEALDDYNTALKLQPNDPLFLSYRADYYFHRLDRAESVADYEKLVVLKPENALYFNRLGQLLFETGNFNRSLAALNQAVSLKPDYFDALLNRALTLDELGELEAALKDFSSASQLQPESGTVYTLRAIVFLKQDRLDETWNDLEKALRLEPELEIAHASLSRYWLARRNPEKARQEAELVLKNMPDFADAYYLIGESLSQENDFEQALNFYKQASTLNQKHPDYIFAKAHTFLMLGQEKEALVEIKKVSNLLTKLSLKAKYENFWSNYHGLHRRWDEALPHANEAVRLSPQSGKYQFTLAEILWQLGREKLAETAYQKSCQLGYADGCKRIGVGTP